MDWKVLKKGDNMGRKLYKEISITGKKKNFIHFAMDVGEKLSPKVEILESEGSKGKVLIGFRKADSIDSYRIAYHKKGGYKSYNLYRNVGIKNGKYPVKRDGDIIYIEAEKDNKGVSVNEKFKKY